MTLVPTDRQDLSNALRKASVARSTVASWDLSAFHRIVEYHPEDMTVTVEAGMTLESLQRELRARGQWLPMDPPAPGGITIEQLLARNLSGPRRAGFGTVRDHLIGLRAVLGDGQLIHSGGRVVKNVAGYDLLKLFIGARGSLGIVVEATFKVLPVPEAEAFLKNGTGTLAGAGGLLEGIHAASPSLTPSVLDLHQASPAEPVTVTIGFSGSTEEVEAQVERAGRLGFRDRATLDHDLAFRQRPGPEPRRTSVAPSRLVATLERLAPESFVARAANGIIDSRHPRDAGIHPFPSRDPQPVLEALTRRVKAALDPHHVLPLPPGLDPAFPA